MYVEQRIEAARDQRTRPSPLGLGRQVLDQFRDIVVAMRPQQVVKNAVVFAPAAFALRFDGGAIWGSLIAFACFSAAASATYLVNDCVDAAADRAHPRKWRRPIAAGRVSRGAAVSLAVGLVASSLIVSFTLTPALSFTILLYLVLQAAYNLGLKREPIVDVMCIASGFVLRALGGAAAASVPLSTWFLLCIALLALFLGIEKRLSEVRTVNRVGDTRDVLRAYSERWLLRMESTIGASALMAYGLWAAQRTNNHWMLATVPVVAYVLFKYQMQSEEGAEDAPEMVLLRSGRMLFAIALWGAMTMGILLLQGHGAPWKSCASGC